MVVPFTDAIYPTSVSLDKVVYPIQTAAMQKRLGPERNDKFDREFVETIVRNGKLWELQQAVFDAKVEMMKFLIDHGQVRVNSGEVEVEVIVRVVQKTVDSEATDGKDIAWPDNNYSIVAYKQSLASWKDDWNRK